MTAPTIQTGLRAAGLEDLHALLVDHHARRLDVVAGVDALTALPDGTLRVAGVEDEVELTDDGVTRRKVDGLYLPTRHAHGQLATALGVPQEYARKMANTHPELWAANINGWLRHSDYAGKSYMARTLRGEGTGVLRALVSDRYKVIDNLDVLMAALDGIREAGVQVEIPQADLTDTRMYVRVRAPEVAQVAEDLLRGYRSPFDFGVQRAGDQRVWTSAGPVVFAGFVLSNSEVGAGAFTIAPQVVYRICGNGMTITREAVRKTHLGEKLEAGVVQWSDATQAKLLELIKSQTTDAVRTFLSPGWLATQVAKLEELAGVPVTDGQKAFEVVGSKLNYGETARKDLLRHFSLAGQWTAGGVANAMTSVAQTVEDADLAYRMEADAFTAMELVAANR